MKPQPPKDELTSEVLIMPDGQIYAHNLTPAMAAVLSELNPDDPNIRQRVITHVDEATKRLLPVSWHTPPSAK
ncbi:MAG: hypothetical protein L0Y58_02705 [Verrucomicrobia subdivision 3 bacterium]|nr:hypothetical protein [Limisphaerales bacterium]